MINRFIWTSTAIFRETTRTKDCQNSANGFKLGESSNFSSHVRL